MTNGYFKENFKFLNAYLKRIVPIVNTHKGLVHQFLGDGIMALFLDKPEDAIRVIGEQVMPAFKQAPN